MCIEQGAVCSRTLEVVLGQRLDLRPLVLGIPFARGQVVLLGRSAHPVSFLSLDQTQGSNRLKQEQCPKFRPIFIKMTDECSSMALIMRLVQTRCVPFWDFVAPTLSTFVTCT